MKHVTTKWTCDICGEKIPQPKYIEGEAEYCAWGEAPYDKIAPFQIMVKRTLWIKAGHNDDLCTACELSKLQEAWNNLMDRYSKKMYGDTVPVFDFNDGRPL